MRDTRAHTTDASIGRGAHGITATRRDAQAVVADLAARATHARAGVHDAGARTAELSFGARDAFARGSWRAREVARRAIAACCIARRDVGASAARRIAELTGGAAHALAGDGQAARKARAVDARLLRAAHDPRTRIDGRDACRATALARSTRALRLAWIGLADAAEAQERCGAVEIALARGRPCIEHERIEREERGIHAGVVLVERRSDRRCAGITRCDGDGEWEGDGDESSAQHVDLRGVSPRSCERSEILSGASNDDAASSRTTTSCEIALRILRGSHDDAAMGPHSEGIDALEPHADSLLADTRIVACLCVWLGVISFGMAALWFDASPAEEGVTHASARP